MGFVTENNNCFWSKGQVPFTFSSSLTRDEQKAIEGAIKIWNDSTPITLFRRGSHKDHVHFRRSSTACNSKLGRQGGRQIIQCTFVGSNGTTPRTRAIIHEIGHALGFIHEHKRPDRNNHVRMAWRNIQNSERARSQFRIEDDERPVGPYDQVSIMHYPRIATRWAINRSNPTTVAIDGNPLSNTTLSDDDIRTAYLIYGRDRGNLLWSQHSGFKDGDPSAWKFNYGKQIGTGWQRFRSVFGTQNALNVIYAIEKNGDLKWYRHTGASDGTPKFTKTFGVEVGTGWQRFLSVCASNQGIIYAIEKNGDLKWYKHEGFRSGKNQWHPKSGTKIGTGWNRFKQVICAGSGILYAIEKNGDLKWYRHTGAADGRNQWAPNSEALIGTGWSRFRQIFASVSTIYAIEKDGRLKWYRHLGFSTGANRWDEDSQTQIGTGWQIYNQVFSTGNGRIYGRIR